MWLLDANMDVHLVDVLLGLGISCESAIHKGWQEPANGQLMKAAADAGFTCILTKDRLFAESASQALVQAPQLSIIVVRLPQMPWREYTRQFRAAWDKHPIAPSAGTVIQWPLD